MPVHIKSTPDGENGELVVGVSGELGFEAARELLLLCRSRWETGVRSIRVDMEGVTSIGSSAIGTLVLLAELVGDGRLQVHMNGCSDGVHNLFASGLLDKYFGGAVVYSSD